MENFAHQANYLPQAFGDIFSTSFDPLAFLRSGPNAVESSVPASFLFDVRVAALAKEWTSGTKNHSSPETMMEHPAFTKMLGCGRAAIPALLRALPSSSPFLCLVFEELTGNPTEISDDEEGDADAMRRYWTNWGKVHEWTVGTGQNRLPKNGREVWWELVSDEQDRRNI